MLKKDHEPAHAAGGDGHRLLRGFIFPDEQAAESAARKHRAADDAIGRKGTGSGPRSADNSGDGREAACKPRWRVGIARLFFRAEVTGYIIWKIGDADGKAVGEVFDP